MFQVFVKSVADPVDQILEREIHHFLTFVFLYKPHINPAAYILYIFDNHFLFD